MRLFIIGAGFSHALAGIPLGRDIANLIFSRVGQTSPRERRLYDLAHNYLRVWQYLQDQAKPLRDRLQSEGIQIKDLINGVYPINLEYLLTLIDLNLNEPYVPKGIGVDLTSCPVPYIEGINHFILEDARQFIQHQIYELVEPGSYDSLDEDRLLKLINFISSGDVVVTFN